MNIFGRMMKLWVSLIKDPFFTMSLWTKYCIAQQKIR